MTYKIKFLDGSVKEVEISEVEDYYRGQVMPRITLEILSEILSFARTDKHAAYLLEDWYENDCGCSKECVIQEILVYMIRKKRE